jgi:hypothetical protein
MSDREIILIQVGYDAGCTMLNSITNVHKKSTHFHEVLSLNSYQKL